MSTASYAILAASTVTSTGATTINGDLGVSIGSTVTGFPPGVVNGAQHIGTVPASQAQADALIIRNKLVAQNCTANYGIPTDLGGLTLTPGVYCFTSSIAITGTLTLDGLNNPISTWIFQSGTTLITASNSAMVLQNVVNNCLVSWIVGSSATLGANSQFVGSIIAYQSISFATGATMIGKAIAQNGAITFQNGGTVTNCNTSSCGTCYVPRGPVNGGMQQRPTMWLLIASILLTIVVGGLTSSASRNGGGLFF
jgi:hypothetical protein